MIRHIRAAAIGAALAIAALAAIPAARSAIQISGDLILDSCTASGSTPQTCNGRRGVVTTNSLTTAGATNAAYVINNSAVVATSQIACSTQAYSGTIVTNGYPTLMSCVAGAGTITVNVTNTHATNALAGTVAIGFVVLN